MRNTIHKIIREDVKTFINTDYSFSHLISEDDETGDKLLLIVSLTPMDGYNEFIYGFMLYDHNFKQKSDFITKRSTVKKHLPNDLIGTQQIFPIIIKLTRKLLDKMLPKKIIRRTDEILTTTHSLQRYEAITNVLLEYDYKIADHKIVSGVNYWTFVREQVTDKNNDLLESYVIDDIPVFDTKLQDYLKSDEHRIKLKEWYESFKKEN